MKTRLVWVLTLVCLLTLAGCRTGEGGNDTGEEKMGEARGQAVILDGTEEQENGAAAVYAQVSAARVQDTAEKQAVLSPEDADRVAKLLEKEGWNEAGTADCLNDCVLTVNGASIYYHSGCGTFNDEVGQRSLTLAKEERDAFNAILGKYIILGFDLMEETWGAALSVRDVTPTGLTLICTQSGGAPTGELQTGSPFWLEKYVGGAWEMVPLVPTCVDWTMEAYLIPMNDSVEWEVNWGYLYGELPAGVYRIGKDIMDFRNAGDYDEREYHAQFTIAEP